MKFGGGGRGGEVNCGECHGGQGGGVGVGHGGPLVRVGGGNGGVAIGLCTRLHRVTSCCGTGARRGAG